MSNSVPATKVLFPFIVIAVTVVLACAGLTSAQQRGTAPATMPGPSIRERNRQMDEYDRELDRLKNGVKVSTERRRNLFPQINEDFQRIQVIHNEMVRMVQADNSLNYDRLAELTGELKKRTNRLRSNLALPDSDDSEDIADKDPAPIALTDADVKKDVVSLHYVIVSFVTSPLFKNLGLLDANAVSKANRDLRNMVQLSDNIKRSVETLNKTAKK